MKTNFKFNSIINIIRIDYWKVKPMKFAWIMAEGKIWDVKKQFITTALESGIEYIVDFTDVERIKKLGNLSIVSDTADADIIMVGRNSEGDGTLTIP